MTTLTLIYCTNAAGDFTDPKTGKCWDIDRDFFRETIKGKSIICGRKTLEADYKGLESAETITVLSHIPDYSLFARARKMGIPAVKFRVANFIASALDFASRDVGGEIYCIGGKQTIEAFAPFASRLLITEAANDGFWLPPFIRKEYYMMDSYEEVCGGGGAADTEIPLWQIKEAYRAENEPLRHDIRRYQRIKF